MRFTACSLLHIVATLWEYISLSSSFFLLKVVNKNSPREKKESNCDGAEGVVLRFFFQHPLQPCTPVNALRAALAYFENRHFQRFV